MESHVLDEHGLHQVVGRIGLRRHGLADELVGLGILGLAAGLRQAPEQLGDEVAFLRCHACSPCAACRRYPPRVRPPAPFV